MSGGGANVHRAGVRQKNPGVQYPQVVPGSAGAIPTAKRPRNGPAPPPSSLTPEQLQDPLMMEKIFAGAFSEMEDVHLPGPFGTESEFPMDPELRLRCMEIKWVIERKDPNDRYGWRALSYGSTRPVRRVQTRTRTYFVAPQNDGDTKAEIPMGAQPVPLDEGDE